MDKNVKGRGDVCWEYQERVDGSNRITLRNHGFFGKIWPVVGGSKSYTPKTSDPPPNSESLQQQPPEEAMNTEMPSMSRRPTSNTNPM